MRIIFIRRQDYWIFPLSIISAVMVETFLYAGVFWIRALSGIIGFSLLFFIYSIIKKNYSQKLAVRYFLIMLVAIIATVAALYALTN